MGVLCFCDPRQGASVSGMSRRSEGQTRRSKEPFDHGRVTALLNPQRPLPFPPRARKGVRVVGAAQKPTGGHEALRRGGLISP